MRLLNDYSIYSNIELKSSFPSTGETTAHTMFSSRISTTAFVTATNRVTITSASTTSQERSFTPSVKVPDTLSSVITDILTTANLDTTTTVRPTPKQTESSNNIF